MKRHSITMMGASALALAATAFLGAGTASANDNSHSHNRGSVAVLKADLKELNGSGARGKAVAVMHDDRLKGIAVKAHGLLPNAPHAQHIHFGEEALHECPTSAFDSNADGRVNTVEGIPAYGPIVLSLTTNGDTTPGSGLDVSRMPVASDSGTVRYLRTNLGFTDVAGTGYAGGIGTAHDIAQAVRNGEGVVVIHGVDYNGNGVYDFEGAGASELDGTLPAEATDPAACGVLRVLR